jgi:hypothetical protein
MSSEYSSYGSSKPPVDHCVECGKSYWYSFKINATEFMWLLDISFPQCTDCTGLTVHYPYLPPRLPNYDGEVFESVCREGGPDCHCNVGCQYTYGGGFWKLQPDYIGIEYQCNGVISPDPPSVNVVLYHCGGPLVLDI